MRTTSVLLFALLLTVSGCAGLQSAQITTKRLTPNAARVITETVTEAHKSLCTDGVALEQREAKVRVKSPNPRYRQIFPGRLEVSAKTRAKVECE